MTEKDTVTLNLKIYSPHCNVTAYLYILNTETFLSNTNIMVPRNNQFESINLTKSITSDTNRIVVGVNPSSVTSGVYIDELMIK